MFVDLNCHNSHYISNVTPKITGTIKLQPMLTDLYVGLNQFVRIIRGEMQIEVVDYERYINTQMQQTMAKPSNHDASQV